MKRAAAKTFKALHKKGMTRAFIETGAGDFVFPPIKKSNAVLRGKNILLAVLPALLVALSVWVFNALQPTGTPLPDVFRTDRFGMTPLHHAVIRPDPARARALIRAGAVIDAADAYGWTPLHWAVFRKDKTMCKLLLQQGANIRLKTSKAWYTVPAGLTVTGLAEMMNAGDLVRVPAEEE
jgi:hypothetical protein